MVSEAKGRGLGSLVGQCAGLTTTTEEVDAESFCVSERLNDDGFDDRVLMSIGMRLVRLIRRGCV